MCNKNHILAMKPLVKRTREQRNQKLVVKILIMF